ncbi:MAG: hypothetical protein FJ279_10860, partial [Planctomycetes bacterium]|nr:hypothetical protein [Planctomycetota bacterium]
MTINHRPSRIRGLVGWAAPSLLVCLLASAAAQGRLDRINGYLVLHVAGTPTEMGEQHGRLLRPQVQRMVQDLIVRGEGWTEDAYKALIQGTRVMEKHLPSDFREELQALAKAADVKYDDLVAAQLFGDVRRALPAPAPA